MTAAAATQRDRLRHAVQLLGGPRAMAAALGMGERTLHHQMAGTSPIHTGTLRRVAALLIARADACRAAERLLNPAFVANLTADQLARPPHGNAKRT